MVANQKQFDSQSHTSNQRRFGIIPLYVDEEQRAGGGVDDKNLLILRLFGSFDIECFEIKDIFYL